MSEQHITVTESDSTIECQRPILVVETTRPDDQFADCFIGYCKTHGRLNQTQGGFIFVIGFTNADASVKIPLPDGIGDRYLWSNGLHCAQCLSGLTYEPSEQQQSDKEEQPV